MGTTSPQAQNPETSLKIIPQNWKTVSSLSASSLSEIVTDSNGLEGEQKIIQLNPSRKLQQQFSIYHYRQAVNAPLIRCYGAQQIAAKSSNFCGVNNTIKVITQRIVKRYGELPQLCFNQILYVLLRVLQGYQILYQKINAFQVNQRMFGINKEGEVKVWVNQNFADNHPQMQKAVLYTTASNFMQEASSQKEMLNNILQVVEQKCENGRYPQDFSLLVYQNETFENAIAFIIQYIQLNNIIIAERIHPDPNLMYVTKSPNSKIKVTASNYYSEQNKNATHTLQKLHNFQPINSFESKRSQQASYYQQEYGNVQIQQQNQQVSTPKSKQPSQNLKWSQHQYDMLKQNPNIQATQSVYQSSRTPSNYNIGNIGNAVGNVNNVDYGNSPNKYKPKVTFGSGQSYQRHYERGSGIKQQIRESVNEQKMGIQTSQVQKF